MGRMSRSRWGSGSLR